MPDDLSNKLAAIEQSGKARFGDHFDRAVEAVKRAAPNGISSQEMAQIVAAPDPANLLMQLGRHQLMAEASEGSREAEDAFSALRAEERRKHNERKGRVY